MPCINRIIGKGPSTVNRKMPINGVVLGERRTPRSVLFSRWLALIGSDLLADLLAATLSEHTRPMLLADFGTNTEIALWDGQTVWVTSVPGGPAFEGMGMRNGMTAEAGAICRVWKADGLWRVETIDGVSARGYCASGFIDCNCAAIGGKAAQAVRTLCWFLAGRRVLLDDANSRTAICSVDVDIFQRAKASTAAAMMQLLAFAGLKVDDLHRLWMCGSFGQTS